MVGARVLLTVLLGMLLPAILMPSPARSMNLRLTSDLAYTQTSSETEDRSDGTVTENETNRFQQTYRLDASKELFPTLNLNTGMQVEHNRNTSETVGEPESSTRDQQILPYLDLEWRNPLYSLSGGYRERYARSKGSNLATEKDYVTSYNLRGEWRPVEFPRLELNYLHSERYDEPLTTDTESDTWLLNSRYEYRDYEFRYSYLRGEDRNNLDQTETLTSTHSGRVRLNRTFWDGRLSLNAGLRMEYSALEFSGSGPRDFAVSPAGSPFYYVDTNAVPNDNLVSDYQTGDFGDTLDLNSGSFFDIGLDFGEAVSVSKLQLRLNSQDALDSGANIDNLANWAVYTSNDQENWILRSLLAVDYLIEENLFELTLNPGGATEFIMVVYSPPLISNQIGELRVVGIRAFVTRDLDDGSQLTNQVYQAQLGLGWQATEATRFTYTFNLQERRNSLFDERNTRVNNGLSIVHVFNQIFTGTGRVSSGHSWDQGQLDNSNYTYSARLTGRYLETLNQSLIYSGTLEQDEDDGDSTSNSLILRTNAALYEGWDLSFDQGATQQNSDRDGESTSYFVRLQTSLVPHSSYNLIAEYSIDWDNDGERSDSGRLRAFWVPLDTLSFSGEVRLRRNDGDDQVSWEYSASWLPLRDGSLQCVLAYSEEEDHNGNRTWSFTPNLNWKVTHYATLSLRYSRGEQETNSEINRFETALLNFRIFYD